MKIINRKMLGTVCLAIATFLNPFGFDILVYKLTLLTNNYWSTIHILYVFAALFFGLSYICFKINKKILANTLLTLAFFLNPLGYDLIVYSINKIMGDYWVTMRIMYSLAGLFFILFMYLYNINPFKTFKNIIKKYKKNDI